MSAGNLSQAELRFFEGSRQSLHDLSKAAAAIVKQQEINLVQQEKQSKLLERIANHVTQEFPDPEQPEPPTYTIFAIAKDDVADVGIHLLMERMASCGARVANVGGTPDVIGALADYYVLYAETVNREAWEGRGLKWYGQMSDTEVTHGYQRLAKVLA